ncbi:hypothetical protein [Aureimonas sp. AU12]|uniref:hypothetical protein n=1 Tax=Aureimonas sp. AU12 TaxID=1638161 RepID=UPI000784DCE0|nr:hypothetical protein [Aureimonas sp. AU12]
MRFSLRLAALTISLFLLGPASAAEDRLGVPCAIEFADTSYILASADEPQPGYVKQEYLPKGVTFDRYETMMLVEFMEGELKPADVVRAQTQMLDERRAMDPFVNYEILLTNEGDGIILDFLMSGETEEGTRIAEWNAYRYVSGKNPQGKLGGWLIGVSRRAYGDEIAPFLERLRTERGANVATLGAISVPPMSAD